MICSAVCNPCPAGGAWATRPPAASSNELQRGRLASTPNALQGRSASTGGSSNSRLVPLAVGIAVGIGGTLLLLAVLATVAVKRGLVYQWRSNRFHEMQLDPELPGSDGPGSNGGRMAAGFRAAKARMAKPWRQQQGFSIGDASLSTGHQMDQQTQSGLTQGSVSRSAELTAAPSKKQKLEETAGQPGRSMLDSIAAAPPLAAAAAQLGAGNDGGLNGSSAGGGGGGYSSATMPSPFAGMSSSFNKAGSLLQRLLSSSSSSVSASGSSFLLPAGSYVSSAPITPEATGAVSPSSRTGGSSLSSSSCSSTGNGSTLAGSPTSDSSIELYDRSKSSSRLSTSRTSAAASVDGSAGGGNAAAAAASQASPSAPGPISPLAAAGPSPAGPATVSSSSSPATPSPPAARPAAQTATPSAATGAAAGPAALCNASSSDGPTATPGVTAGQVSAQQPTTGTLLCESDLVTAAPPAAGGSDAAGAAAGFDVAQRPCHLAQLVGVSTATPAAILPSSSTATGLPAANPAAGAGAVANSADDFGVAGSVVMSRRPASGVGSVDQPLVPLTTPPGCKDTAAHSRQQHQPGSPPGWLLRSLGWRESCQCHCCC